MPSDDEFFSNVPPVSVTTDAFDAASYRSAPDDWHVAVTDVLDSTGAIARGRHKTVNFIAAASIAGLRNLCAPLLVPFLFAGDGAVVMVPPSRSEAARLVLARLRGFTQREFGLDLRVSMVAVAELRRRATEVSVARYEPSPGNSFGVFLGGGVTLLESSIKGRGDAGLQQLAAIPDDLDDRGELDLTGLSCRWDELHSTNGRMLSLIIVGAREVLRVVHADILALSSVSGSDPRPVRKDTLAVRFPLTGLGPEIRARRTRHSRAGSAVRVLAENVLTKLVFARGRPIGSFDPAVYMQEMITNTDFCLFDDTLSMVVDCPARRVAAVEDYLESRSRTGELRYGVHASNTALMTCLVASLAEHQHVHFVDGADGGYSMAAQRLKGA